MPTKLSNKKITTAVAICSCVDILIDPNTSEEHCSIIGASLKTILQNIMPYLRGVKDSEKLVKDAFGTIQEVKAAIPTLPSQILVKNICDNTNIAEPLAYATIIPELCYTLAKKLASEIPQEIEETEEASLSPLHLSLQRAVDIICKGEGIKALAKQLRFINSVLEIKPLQFIGEQSCRNIVNSVIEDADDNYNLDRSLTEELVYGIFNKTRLKHILDYCERHPKSADILEEISEKYSLKDENIFIDDPFYLKKAERLSFVKGLQKYTLETLILTKKFLDENGLRFYLTEGTLLGAIRHNGFIPWDDDIDIAMPREDYDRLVELANQGKVPPELNFDALENNPKHWVLGAKMQLTRPTPYIQHKVTKLSRCNGPYVDIFPIDYWSRPAGFKFSIANICVKASRRLLFMKTGYSPATKKKPSRIIAKLFLPFVSNRTIEKFAIKNMKKFYNGNRKYSVNLCSYYPYYKEVFLTSFFGEPKFVEFEGEQMPVPCEYDYMLKTVYGKNYDTIPPVRVTNMRKHAFNINPEVKD